MQQPLVKVHSVSKKFCKNIRWSMLHGSAELIRSTFGLAVNRDQLYKEEFWAVRNVSFELKRGEALGILGRNGSGKTTLMRLIAGIYPFETGRIEVNGHLVPMFALKTGVPLFSGRENIYYKGALHGFSREEVEERMDGIIEYAGLERFIDAPMGTYSSGMRARLGFAIAMACEPDIVIVDEALAMGDQAFKERCLEDLNRFAREHAVIIISHSLSQVKAVANRIMVLEKGEMVHETNEVELGIQFYLERYRASQKEMVV